MQVVEGILGPIVMTARHFANFAPSFTYSWQRLASLSRPSVIFSSGQNARSAVPASTLIPGRTPWRESSAANGVPSAAFWRSVSSYRIAPLT